MSLTPYLQSLGFTKGPPDSETPTAEGLRRYADTAGWYIDVAPSSMELDINDSYVHACTCTESCPEPCTGQPIDECNCKACFANYCDATEYE